jgi:hypothetical protein
MRTTDHDHWLSVGDDDTPSRPLSRAQFERQAAFVTRSLRSPAELIALYGDPSTPSPRVFAEGAAA